jgi:hypothetical protein
MNPITGANQQPLQPRNANQVQQNYAYGHVNYVAAENAQQAPDIVFDMFLANSYPGIWPWAKTPPSPAWLPSFPLCVARVAIQSGPAVSCSPATQASLAGLRHHHDTKAESELDAPPWRKSPFFTYLRPDLLRIKTESALKLSPCPSRMVGRKYL